MAVDPRRTLLLPALGTPVPGGAPGCAGGCPDEGGCGCDSCEGGCGGECGCGGGCGGGCECDCPKAALQVPAPPADCADAPWGHDAGRAGSADPFLDRLLRALDRVR